MVKKHPRFTLNISSDGTIFSIKTGKPRKLNLRKDGYLQASVGRSSFLAHRLVAEAHIPNPENKPKINHKNGIKTDNRIENLEWCTQRENILHARDVLGAKYGLSGDESPHTKISEKEILYAKRMFNLGLTKTDIAKVLGVSTHTILRHIKNTTRKNDTNTL